VVNLVVRAQRQPVTTGVQGLIGLTGVAETDLAPAGHVFVRGELWGARAEEPIRKGESVTIRGVEGMTLRVIRRRA
jgi:membrane-bound serine protease (ClpP class)